MKNFLLSNLSKSEPISKFFLFLYFLIVFSLLVLTIFFFFIQGINYQLFFDFRENIENLEKINILTFFIFILAGITWSFFQGFLAPLNILFGFLFGNLIGLFLISITTAIGHYFFYYLMEKNNFNYLKNLRKNIKKKFQNIFKNKNLYFASSKFIIFIPSQIANIFALILRIKKLDFLLICFFAPLPLRILYIFLGDTMYSEMKNFFYNNNFDLSKIFLLAFIIFIFFGIYLMLKNKRNSFFKSIKTLTSNKNIL